MNVDVVADVGNSRIKWGRCAKGAVVAAASLPPDDTAAWEKQLQDWGLSESLAWGIGSVSPENLGGLVRWLQGRGDTSRILTRADQLPIEVLTEYPDRVGIDRLLNAVAAKARLGRRAKGRRPKPTVIIDAGTAVTVDLLGPTGAFEGGAIFPGRRLMATALHDHTAQLPLVAGAEKTPPPVGKNTLAAIEAGIHHAVAGGINQLIRWQLGGSYPRVDHPGLGEPAIFLTGGDGPLLQHSIDNRAVLWPEMTLEGLRISAEAQP